MTNLAGTIINAITNMQIIALQALEPHADKIFGQGASNACRNAIDRARIIKEEFRKFYCGIAKEMKAAAEEKWVFYNDLNNFANDYWFIPVISEGALICTSSMDGDYAGTILHIGLAVIDIVGGLEVKGALKFIGLGAKGLTAADIAADISKADQAAKGAEAVVDSVGTIRKVDKIDANTLHHAFDNPDHKMDSFLAKYGNDQEKAYRAIEDSVMQYIDKTGQRNSADWTKIQVDDMEVYATWRTIDGELKVSDASRRDV